MRWVHGPPTEVGFWLAFAPEHSDVILDVVDMGGVLHTWLPMTLWTGDRDARGWVLTSVNVPVLEDISCRRIEVPDVLPEEVR